MVALGSFLSICPFFGGISLGFSKDSKVFVEEKH